MIIFHIRMDLIKSKKEDIIYAGYGIEDNQYSDYKNIDVKGKVVAVIGGEPMNNNEYFINGKEKSKWSNIRQEINLKSETAKSKGALALIILTNIFTEDILIDINIVIVVEAVREWN